MHAGETPALPGGSRPQALPQRAAQKPCDVAPGHPAAGTPGVRPKQSVGRVAGRAGWRSLPRVCGNACGRDARAPGWISPASTAAASRSISLRCSTRPPCCGNARGSAEAERWRHCGSSRVEEFAEGVRECMRARRPRSRGDFCRPHSKRGSRSRIWLSRGASRSLADRRGRRMGHSIPISGSSQRMASWASGS